MVTQVDVGHGRGWLAPGPAASLLRVDWQIGGVLPTSSLGRTDAEQQKLIDAAAAGDPNVFMPAAVGESPHQLGISADVPRWWDYEAVLNDNGWTRPLPTRDPVHFNYNPDRDNHLNDPIGGFLMELNNVEQRQVYDWLNQIQQALFNGNQIVGPDFAPINVLTSHVIAILGLVKTLAVQGDAQTQADAKKIVAELAATLQRGADG